MNDKLILDACCGGRMFWFNKNNPLAVYVDIREEEHVLCDGRVFNVAPDIKMDFRKLEFPDNSFKLVVFDPPHLLRVGKNSWTCKKYGKLNSDWGNDLKAGFTECMRVLERYGVLIFKWSCRDIPISKIIACFGQQPLFGHKTTAQSVWLTFMKL